MYIILLYHLSYNRYDKYYYKIPLGRIFWAFTYFSLKTVIMSVKKKKHCGHAKNSIFVNPYNIFYSIFIANLFFFFLCYSIMFSFLCQQLLNYSTPFKYWGLFFFFLYKQKIGGWRKKCETYIFKGMYTMYILHTM